MDNNVVFTMTCAYCDTIIRMTKMPEPNDVLICKYCCGMFFCGVTKISIEQLDDDIRCKVEEIIRELRHDKWVN